MIPRQMMAGMFGFLRSAPAVDMGHVLSRVAAGEVTLLDVRDGFELAASGLAHGAIHIPLMQLAQLADPDQPARHPALNPARPVALYCASGARSARAKTLLERMGYTDVTNIGGLRDWVRAGGAITRQTDQK